MNIINTKLTSNQYAKRGMYLLLIATLIYFLFNATATINRLGVMFVAGDIGPIVVTLTVIGIIFAVQVIARDIRRHSRAHSTNINREFNQSRTRRSAERLADAQRPVEVDAEAVASTAEVA